LYPRGYKGPKPEKVEKRHQLVSEVTYATSRWLNLSRDQRELLMASDHLFDAFVSTLVGRAVELGRTLPIPNQARASAVRKGWIHLPERQPLSQFPTPLVAERWFSQAFEAPAADRARRATPF
jgi:hypothetical protein